ncbi:NAD(P)/FAD-dependent oxidoreductase [Anaeroselena agilis]|uniref:NAD(P)/FAD-dependent oxidoreductase n=1 Tax=Anaeroselena agilis TaxID=3063788 RepID=A0ABU3P1Y4_9FIRM|nr:NAD(P)/FAD-dependent oxidoreductase [Selenomonadales bacterium 4137-cl]
MPSNDRTDVIIVGGGIVGAAIARELAKYDLNVLLLERHPDLAMETTKANSAILHAGFDASPGSLKALLNVRGNELFRQLQADLGLELKLTGSLVVATSAAEMDAIGELYSRGGENGVPGLKILSREQVLDIEPNLTEQTLGALHAPTAGIISPFGAALAFAENAALNGVKIIRECPVTAIAVTDGRIAGVHTPHGFIAARFVVNAAGVGADTVSRLAGDDSFRIKPRKGEYLLFDKKASCLVKTVVFPTPTKVSKGILVSPTVHGNMFVGPNALDCRDADDVDTSAAGLAEIVAGAEKLVPGIPVGASITQFAGLRAVADGGDFIIGPSPAVGGLVHAAGIQSPGLTAAPAIAERVAAVLRDLGLEMKPNRRFNPVNPPRVLFSELDAAARQALIRENPLYGRVICRCETITEGEIVAAIHSVCGARTVDGVKRRTRAGMGRCQGGFCGPRVTAILARELSLPVTAVRKDTVGSYLFFDKIPRLCEVDSR